MARQRGPVAPGAPRNFDDVKKLATRPTRAVSLCLAGELAEEHARLVQQLEEAGPATSLGEVSPKRAIAEQIVALEESMREATVDFHLRALRSREWVVLFAEQPSRKEGEATKDWEPRWFEWQAEVVARTCVDPQMNVEQVRELVDMLHFHSWHNLYNKAYVLNMGEVDVPNSAAASELIGNSEQT